MRYVTPVAMPAGLGEWLGAELEARGVEAASLYARAVLSILLHSESEMDREPVHEPADGVWSPRTELDLELRLKRHGKEVRRGRPCRRASTKVGANLAPLQVRNCTVASAGASASQRNVNANRMVRGNGGGSRVGVCRRRPHSWNGDAEELKKCAAIECLLSATDDDQWPVEKLVDELCARLKLLQLDKKGAAVNKWTGLGSSAPECFDTPLSDSDSFTSVSSPEVEGQSYYEAFPPLEFLSDSDQLVETARESIWDTRQKVKSPLKPGCGKKARVPFVRMTGSRLSPQLLRSDSCTTLAVFAPDTVEASCCDASEAYFGDCSRDSSLERARSPLVTVKPAVVAAAAAAALAKGRLYERGPESLGVADSKAEHDDGGGAVRPLSSPAAGFPITPPDVLADTAPQLEPYQMVAGAADLELNGLTADWEDWSLQGSLANIWAPSNSDWLLMGCDSCWPAQGVRVAAPEEAPPPPIETCVEEQACPERDATHAVQLSLALLNHHPDSSSFTPVMPLKIVTAVEAPADGVVVDGVGGRASAVVESTPPVVDGEEKEMWRFFTDADGKADEENLLTSPKTHFCPIQQDGDPEVEVRDGATFQVDAQPEEVHFLRSPSGALYLPECEDDGDGWRGWAKYMVYKTPTSPTPTLAPPSDRESVSRSASPFTLKFRVIQTEKCCQTDLVLTMDMSLLAVGGGSQAADPRPLAISSPFLPVVGAALITAADMWKFDAASVTSSSSVLLQAGLKGSAPAHEEKEDEDGLLDEVWSVTTLQDTVASEDLAQEKSTQCTEERVFQVDDAPQDYPPPLPLEEDCDALLEPAGWCNFGRDLSDEERHDEDAAAKGDLEFELDELWNPYVPDGADDQADVCEWIPPAYEDEAWTEMVADSWPPPNIPVEYLDDEFFDEIYGSLDSARVCGDASGAAGGGGGVAAKGHRRHCRRRRRNIQKQPPVQRRRPCSFFVEGECRRPDCKFSHDLASIPCRFWLESSCFKGDECPFLHAFVTKSDGNHNQHYPCSDAEFSEEGCASEDTEPRFGRSSMAGHHKFHLDLDADFPSLSQAADIKPRLPPTTRPIPIAVHVGFAAADNTGSSVENVASEAQCIKRRRRKFSSHRPSAASVVPGTSSESSPGEIATHMAVAKRSRKVAAKALPANTGFHVASSTLNNNNGSSSSSSSSNADGANGSTNYHATKERTKTQHASVTGQSERRRTKSERGGSSAGAPSSRLRLSSSYKEG